MQHDIPAKITDIDAITPGNKLALVTFHGNAPKDITYATFATTHTPANSTAPTAITLYHFDNNTFNEPIGDATYFAQFDQDGRITEKGTRPNIYTQHDTYVYDLNHPTAQPFVEWVERTIEVHELHRSLTQSVVELGLHDGTFFTEDLDDVRQLIDKIIAEDANAKGAKHTLDEHLAEYR